MTAGQRGRETLADAPWRQSEFRRTRASTHDGNISNPLAASGENVCGETVKVCAELNVIPSTTAEDFC